MAKFKVGDKVRVKVFGTIPYYWSSDMEKWMGKVVTLEQIAKKRICAEDFVFSIAEDNFEFGSSKYVWKESDFEPIEPRREFIVIRRSGAETIAELRHDREVIKSAKATCAPSDTFDLDTGAKLAFDRLMGREEPKPAPTKPPHHWIESKEAERRSRFSIGDRVVSLDCEGSGTVIGFEHDGNIMHGIDWVYVEWDKYPNRYNPKLEKNLRKETYPAPQPAHRFKVGDQVVSRYFNGVGEISAIDEKASHSEYLVFCEGGVCSGEGFGVKVAKPAHKGKCNWVSECFLSPAPAPEPPKFYTGKVVCVEWKGEIFRHKSAGRIAIITNGISDYDGWNRMSKPFESFSDFCSANTHGVFCEIKE